MKHTAAADSAVSVRCQYRASDRASARRLAEGARRAVRLVLRAAAAQAGEVTVVLADDPTVRELNRRYRGHDRTTDVLAFPQNGPAHVLGDVVISVPQAARQARRAGHPLGHEVALLAIHGTLHLLGYEDETPAGRRLMYSTQTELLRRWVRGGRKP